MYRDIVNTYTYWRRGGGVNFDWRKSRVTYKF